MKRTELTAGLASLMALGLCACASTGETGTAAAQPQSAQPATYHEAVEDSARRNNAHVRWVNSPRTAQESDTTRSPSAEQDPGYEARVEQTAKEQGTHVRWVNPPQDTGDDDE